MVLDYDRFHEQKTRFDPAARYLNGLNENTYIATRRGYCVLLFWLYLPN